MYLSIDTSQRIDLRKVKAERVPCGDIWLYAGNGVGRIYMDDEGARELVKQLAAILSDGSNGNPAPTPPLQSASGPDQPARQSCYQGAPLATEDDEPDPRGYVFIARDGKAWGHLDAPGFRGPRKFADRPFLSVDEALDASMGFAFGPVVFEVWTPESGVPPMPEVTP